MKIGICFYFCDSLRKLLKCSTSLISINAIFLFLFRSLEQGRLLVLDFFLWLSVKALAGPCRTEPTIVTEVGLRRITIFGTGFYNLIKRKVNIDEL